MRILIADDSELIRRRVRDVLSKHDGWEVCGEAASGEPAIAMARELKPDVIVLDLVMPDIDGLQVAREIGNLVLVKPQILIYTLQTIPALDVEARRIGVQRVVPKSDLGVLVEAIEDLCKAKTPEPSSEAFLVGAGAGRRPASLANGRTGPREPPMA